MNENSGVGYTLPHSIIVPSKITMIKPIIKAFEYKLIDSSQYEHDRDKKMRYRLVYELKNFILTRATYAHFNENRVVKDPVKFLEAMPGQPVKHTITIETQSITDN